MKTFPVLFKKTNTGAIQQWTISVDDATIQTTHGQVGGKLQTTTDTINEGKNVGKANATTPVTQALAEAEAKWTKQKKKGYVESAEAAEAGEVDAVIEGGILPMLAPSKVYPTFAHKLTFPVWVDPKYDGTRMVAVLKDGVCTLWSRTRKRINSLPHIESAIETHFGPNVSIVLDGEAFSYDYRNNFEDLLSFIRQEEPKKGHEVVDYHIYDLPSHPGTFNKRHQDLYRLLDNAPRPLVRVERHLANSHEEVMALHEKNLALEYEGSMVRGDGPYEGGKRSYFLQKLKNFEDREYAITGAEEGRGKDTGTVGAFVCRTPEGKEFKARLKATYERRRELFENSKQWRGLLLTVTYQNLTSDGIPRFPIGKGLRVSTE